MIEWYISLSSSIKSVILITLFLLIVIVILSIRLRKYDENTPFKGIFMLLEYVVEWGNNLSKDCFGKRWKWFAPYIVTVAIYLTTSNLCGLLGMTPPTMNFSVCLGLSIVTFFLIEFAGYKTQGWKSQVKGLFEPVFILFPINVIGEISGPFSMAARLFGNILSGVIISTLIYGFFGWPAMFVTPAIHAIFDIVFGIIQTIVYCTLTAVFISSKLPENES